jgi:hypothetical protein
MAAQYNKAVVQEKKEGLICELAVQYWLRHMTPTLFGGEAKRSSVVLTSRVCLFPISLCSCVCGWCVRARAVVVLVSILIGGIWSV